ncbi:GNAT family N-acetyltransferase [Paenibacillus sp. FSL H7-0331]|uniref:GNAT family N-acetyltransferase n=1 Tax=Paenibacillus sp. FSL H7-0331 TaxID=1920421 RepID=UPI00117C9E74|nr:GNAT family N-acetyltransferase [Paenibacillus sp. FSL H7-0331]
MINLKEYKDTKAIIELLTECMYPDQERVLREFEAYQSNEFKRLLGIIENDELVGLIGVITQDDDQVELKHIAVKSSHRRQGLGKSMIMTYMEESLVSTEDKTTLYIVRHGQTEWNIQHKIQGHQDSPLTEKGIQQAQWLSEALGDAKIDIIYSSSSRRAVRTAELIRHTRDIEIKESDAFKEMNMGVWEGRTQEEVQDSDPESWDYFWNDPEKFQIQGGETFSAVSERSVNELNRILYEHRGKSILIVTHSVVVKLLMALFENRSMNNIWNPPYIHPACLCKVEFLKGVPEIILHADIAHYQEEGLELT